MSILKTNNISIEQQPIDREWLKTTSIFDLDIPCRMIRPGWIKTYCELRILFRPGAKEDEQMTSIWESFICTSYTRYGRTGIEGIIIETKDIWHENGKVYYGRELSSKGDVLKFLSDCKKIINDEYNQI